MKAVKIVLIAALAWVGIVVAFESLIGILQPTTGETLVITTFDADGAAHERVLARIESDGKLYVAANHWPRAWYDRARENPDVQVTLADENGAYRAAPIEGAEYDRVNAEQPLPLVIRFVTGFPPRRILRLDPQGA